MAINKNLTETQLSLVRSPAHLRNMVKKKWTRVGLGIAQDSKSAFYLTQEFSSRDLSTHPLLPKEIEEVRQEVQNFIKSKYPQIKS